MIICLGILLFVIGCVVEVIEDASYDARRRDERHYKNQQEIIKAISEQRALEAKRERRELRRYAQDKEGNIVAEERIEEIER